MSIPVEVLAQLPTPCLIVDLEAADRNIATAAALFRDGPARLRPHFKAHKCTALIRRQLAAGGCVGVTCQTAYEALVLAEAGIPDILVANETTDSFALDALAAAAQKAAVMTCVDHERHVALLADLAARHGVEIGVLIELDVGIGRCGLPVGSDRLISLARAIADAPGLVFRGIQAYEGHVVNRDDRELRRTLVWQAAQQVRHEKERLEQAGFPCPLVSGGGTGTWDLTGQTGVYNEVQAGSYVLMDSSYGRLGLPFEYALFCATRVISRRALDAGVLNGGLKAMSAESGMPLSSLPGVTVIGLSDEHARLRVAPGVQLEVGDPVLLIPSHIDPTINLYDAVYVWSPREGLQRWAIDGRRVIGAQQGIDGRWVIG
jgi:D-serine deaminase-like pyridoxal phosphate-dependent protein